MHLTEGRNTGFRKILNALERNGSPKPIFETDPERLSFSTTLLIHPDFLHQNEGDVGGDNEGDIEGVILSEKEKLVLNAIQNNPAISVSKMVTKIGIPKSTLERIIKGLKTKKIVMRDGPDNGGKWIILK